MRNKAKAALNLSYPFGGENFFKYHVHSFHLYPYPRRGNWSTIWPAHPQKRQYGVFSTWKRRLQSLYGSPITHAGSDVEDGSSMFFWFFFAQAMPAAIFGFAVGFFPFIGSAVPSLGFTVIFSFSSDSAMVAAVGLSSKAASTDTENQFTPSAADLDQ